MKVTPSVISPGCVENKLVETVPIEIQQHTTLESRDLKVCAREGIDDFDLHRIAVVNIEHTDLVGCKGSLIKPCHKLIIYCPACFLYDKRRFCFSRRNNARVQRQQITLFVHIFQFFEIEG